MQRQSIDSRNKLVIEKFALNVKNVLNHLIDALQKIDILYKLKS